MKKVAIIGRAPTWKLAPQNMERWTLNYTPHVKADRRFELHTKQKHREWLKTLTVPVYMQKKHDDIPMSVEYPLKEILNEFGDYLFTSTMAYMIALAIYERYNEIHVYGVDLLLREEYIRQKPGIVGLIEHARGKGIKVVVPEESALLKKSYLYGYETKEDYMINIQLGELPGILDGLNEILNKELPVKPAYWFGKITKKLQKEYSELEENRIKLARKYARKDDNGEPVIEDNKYMFDEPGLESFNTALGELLETEIEVEFNPVSPDQLGDIKISPMVLMALEKFIEVE